MTYLKKGYVLCEARNESSIGSFSVRTPDPNLFLKEEMYFDEGRVFVGAGCVVVVSTPFEELPQTPDGLYIVKLSDILWVGETDD
tara:strand:- start:26266 stop:26520 length:255 start_codon:yes stop_codon:yes gene_type:complete